MIEPLTTFVNKSLIVRDKGFLELLDCIHNERYTRARVYLGYLENPLYNLKRNLRKCIPKFVKSTSTNVCQVCPKTCMQHVWVTFNKNTHNSKRSEN